MDDNVKHPEAYPSIERSLDKIVDKMYGNTVEVDPPKEYAFTYLDQSYWTQR